MSYLFGMHQHHHRGMGSILADRLRARGLGSLLTQRLRARGLGSMGQAEADIATLLRLARPETFPSGDKIKAQNFQTCQPFPQSKQLSDRNQQELATLFRKIKSAATNLYRELDSGNKTLVDAINTIPGALTEQEIVLFSADLEAAANVLNNLKTETVGLEDTIVETIDQERAMPACPLAYGHFPDGRNNMPGWRKAAQEIERAFGTAVTELKARRAVASRDIAKVKERIRKQEAEAERLRQQQEAERARIEQERRDQEKLEAQLRLEEEKLRAERAEAERAARERETQLAIQEASKEAEAQRAASEAQVAIEQARIAAQQQESQLAVQLQQQAAEAARQAEARQLELELARIEREEERLRRQEEREEKQSTFMLLLETLKAGLLPKEVAGQAIAQQLGVELPPPQPQPQQLPGFGVPGMPALPPGYAYQQVPGAGPGFPGAFPGAGFPGAGFPGVGFPGAFPGAGFPGAGFGPPAGGFAQPPVMAPAFSQQVPQQIPSAAPPVPLPPVAQPQPQAGFNPFQFEAFTPGQEMFGMGNNNGVMPKPATFPQGVVLDTTNYEAFDEGTSYRLVRKDDGTSFQVPRELVLQGETITDKKRGGRAALGNPSKVALAVVGQGLSGMGDANVDAVLAAEQGDEGGAYLQRTTATAGELVNLVSKGLLSYADFERAKKGELTSGQRAGLEAEVMRLRSEESAAKTRAGLAFGAAGLLAAGLVGYAYLSRR